MAVISYKCPNCDGPLTWNGSKGKFVCDYCLSSFTEAELEQLKPVESEDKTVDASGTDSTAGTPGVGGDTASSGTASREASKDAGAKQKSQSAAKMKVYSCPSCGARITADDTTAASICYYCHNPIVLMDKLDEEDTTDFIIPFEIDNKKAEDIFDGWIKRQKYVPDGFYDARQIEHLSGVYFPYWVYSCHVSTEVSGEGRKVRTWDSMGMRNTETSVYDISNSGDMDVNNLSRIALKKASRILCESVMPFDTSHMKEFNAGYLQGYVAETKDIEQSDITAEVREEVNNYAKSETVSQVSMAGYDKVDISAFNARVSSEKFSYALMPIWTVTYKASDGKMYYFSINGQSGKTCGELPTDSGKLRKLFIMTFIPIFVIMLIILFFV